MGIWSLSHWTHRRSPNEYLLFGKEKKAHPKLAELKRGFVGSREKNSMCFLYFPGSFGLLGPRTPQVCWCLPPPPDLGFVVTALGLTSPPWRKRTYLAQGTPSKVSVLGPAPQTQESELSLPEQGHPGHPGVKGRVSIPFSKGIAGGVGGYQGAASRRGLVVHCICGPTGA